MYILYYKPGSCSMAVHVLLRELGEVVELKHYLAADGESPNPDLVKVNPSKNVPTLVSDDYVIREGAAILSWLCDEYESELLPRSGKARADALQWLMFANSTVHQTYVKLFWVSKQALLSTEIKEGLYQVIQQELQGLWDQLENQLQGRDYVCGDTITIGDIMLTIIANWTPKAPVKINYGPRSKALFKRVSERETYQKALEVEGVDYKVAA